MCWSKLERQRCVKWEVSKSQWCKNSLQGEGQRLCKHALVFVRSFNLDLIFFYNCLTTSHLHECYFNRYCCPYTVKVETAILKYVISNGCARTKKTFHVTDARPGMMHHAPEEPLWTATNYIIIHTPLVVNGFLVSCFKFLKWTSTTVLAWFCCLTSSLISFKVYLGL